MCLFGKEISLGFSLLNDFRGLVFLWPIYIAFNDGYVIGKGSKRMASELSFYSYLLKEFFIASLFIWLGTGGAREKKTDVDDEK